MILCKTHLVECLKTMNIKPIPDCKSEFKEYALIYNKNNYFASEENEVGQWWSIDFRRNIVLTSYQIIAGVQCNWVSQWKILLSINNEDWVPVSNHTGYPYDEIFPVYYNFPVRYLKIEGKNDCHQKLAFYYINFFGLYL